MLETCLKQLLQLCNNDAVIDWTYVKIVLHLAHDVGILVHAVELRVRETRLQRRLGFALVRGTHTQVVQSYRERLND